MKAIKEFFKRLFKKKTWWEQNKLARLQEWEANHHAYLKYDTYIPKPPARSHTFSEATKAKNALRNGVTQIDDPIKDAALLGKDFNTLTNEWEFTNAVTKSTTKPVNPKRARAPSKAVPQNTKSGRVHGGGRKASAKPNAKRGVRKTSRK